jgi:hypothetical protein
LIVSPYNAGVKRETFYHLSLSLPYIVLAISGAFTYFTNGLDVFNEVPSSSLNILTGMMIFFTISAIIWGPLYTWMVIAMLFWGRGKSPDAVRRMYILSPLLLACSMGLPALLVGIPDSGLFLLWGFLQMNHLDFVMPILFENYYQEQSLSIGLAWAFMAAICVVIGYAFVGIALLIERTLKKQNLFKSEERLEGL